MSTENLFTPDCIRTVSGIYVNVFAPTEDMIDINDIAHSLSNQCRFGGHLPEFYSVAQHSVLCAELSEPKYKLQALLHDASEAYILDIPSPIKPKLYNYKEIEDEIMMIISKKFGFLYPISQCVRRTDNDMLRLEWHELMLQEKSIASFRCWSPGYAKAKFLEAYHRIVSMADC